MAGITCGTLLCTLPSDTVRYGYRILLRVHAFWQRTLSAEAEEER